MFGWKETIGRILSATIRRENAALIGAVYFVRVHPDQISHIKLFNAEAFPLLGGDAVCGSCGGNWDRMKMPFRFHYLYRTIRKRLNGEGWEATPLYRRRIKSRSREAVDRECRKIDRLIDEMREKGYRTQYELGNIEPNPKWLNIGVIKVPEEIVIGMDRHGRFMQLLGGRHRLAIAQNLGLKEMPAIVSLFHSNATEALPEERRSIQGEIFDFSPL